MNKFFLWKYLSTHMHGLSIIFVTRVNIWSMKYVTGVYNGRYEVCMSSPRDNRCTTENWQQWPQLLCTGLTTLAQVTAHYIAASGVWTGSNVSWSYLATDGWTLLREYHWIRISLSLISDLYLWDTWLTLIDNNELIKCGFNKEDRFPDFVKDWVCRM